MGQEGPQKFEGECPPLRGGEYYITFSVPLRDHAGLPGRETRRMRARITTLYMDVVTLRRCDEACQKAIVSRSEYIRRAIREKLERDNNTTNGKSPLYKDDDHVDQTGNVVADAPLATPKRRRDRSVTRRARAVRKSA